MAYGKVRVCTICTGVLVQLLLQQFSGWLSINCERRESAHARTFGGDFELCMHGVSLQFLDNQPENRCRDLAKSMKPLSMLGSN